LKDKKGGIQAPSFDFKQTFDSTNTQALLPMPKEIRLSPGYNEFFDVVVECDDMEYKYDEYEHENLV